MTLKYQTTFDTETIGPASLANGGWLPATGSEVFNIVDASTSGVSGFSGKVLKAPNDAIVMVRQDGAKAGDQVAWHEIPITSYTSGSNPVVMRGAIRCNPDIANDKYYFLPVPASGTTWTLRILRHDNGGGADLTGTSTPVTATVGDIFIFAYAAIGTTISGWLWKKGTARPSTPTFTATDSGLAIGHPALISSGASVCDNFGWGTTLADLDAAYAAPTITSVTVAPSTATVSGGATQQFTATVAGSGAYASTVTWSTSAGSITSGGLLTAPTATSSAQTVTVTATSTQDGTKASTATVTVPLVSSTVSGVTVAPTTATVAGGATQAFTATVAGTGSPSQTVNWSTSAGTINSSGVLTAPAGTSSSQTVTVTATSAQDGSKSGTATVTVPALALKTYTATNKLVAAADGAPAANVAIHAFVHDMTTGALVGSKTGLTTSSTGLPPAFTGTFGVTGTAYDVKYVSDASPLRRSLEVITPT